MTMPGVRRVLEGLTDVDETELVENAVEEPE
jgi:hypothetical protein